MTTPRGAALSSAASDVPVITIGQRVVGQGLRMTSPFNCSGQRARKDLKSHVVGLATYDEGARTTAYRAVVAAVCGRCRRAIQPDELFSLHLPRLSQALSHVMTRVPICTTCRPLRVAEPTDAPGPPG